MKIKDQTDLIESIEHIANSLPRFVRKKLTQQISTENAVTIIEFIKYQKTESNISDDTRNIVVRCLIILAKFTNKNFKQFTRAEIINYLDSLRKSEEVDPAHKWNLQF